MEPDDAEIVARARLGDTGAYKSLVERHGRGVYRLAYRLTGNGADAEDVVQETFMRAYQRIEEFESRAGFGSWLYRIAHNYAVDLIRSRRRQGIKLDSPRDDESDPMENLPDEAMAPDQVVFGGQVRHKVHLAMRRLTPSERAAFVLRHFEHRSIEEISSMMQQPTGATKQAIFRAVKKLRRELEPLASPVRW